MYWKLGTANLRCIRLHTAVNSYYDLNLTAGNSDKPRVALSPLQLICQHSKQEIEYNNNNCQV